MFSFIKKIIIGIFSYFKDKRIVSHIRLTGVIGNVGKFKQGIDFSSQQEIIKKAFSVEKIEAVAISINSPGGSPVQSHLIYSYVRKMAKEKKLVYGFKTPFFPVVPAIGFAVVSILAVYLLFAQPLSWAIAIVWIGIGFLIYKLYTSKREKQAIAPLVFNQEPSERKEYRILVVFSKSTATKLAKIASAIADQKAVSYTHLTLPTKRIV